MALKRWAVRQLSGLLSDYLEGITEQNLQASLSLEVGQVDISHVRAQPGLFAERSLCLLSSDVGGVSARIPWRSLGSEPTVITVRDVWVEVQAESVAAATTASEAEAALRRWRARRRRRVKASVDATRAAAAAAEAGPDDPGGAGGGAAPQKRRSVAARLGHAALRQLQVRVEGLRIRVHPEKSRGGPPVELSCVRFALDEGFRAQGNVADVPEEIRRHPASLDKVLEVVGLSAQLLRLPRIEDAQDKVSTDEGQELRERLAQQQRDLQRANAGSDAVGLCQRDLSATKLQLQQKVGTPMPIVGPMSLDARVWHSAADGLLWQCVELQVADDASVLRLSPSVARYLCDGLEWYRSTLEAPAQARRLLQRLAAAPGEAVAHKSTTSASNHDEVSPSASATAPLTLCPLSGTEYMDLCGKRLRGETFDEERVDEIEDLASEDWLVRWQLRCHEQLDAEEQDGGNDGRSAMSTNNRRESAGGTDNGGRTSRVVGWLRRRWGSRTAAAAGDEDSDDADGTSSSEDGTGGSGAYVKKDSTDGSSGTGDTAGDGDDGVIADLVADDMEEPRRVELKCVIRQCTIVACRLYDGVEGDVASDSADSEELKLNGGVECCGSVSTPEGAGSTPAGTLAGLLQAMSWDADVNTNLSSIAVLLGGEPLMLLQQDSTDTCCFEDCFEDEEELAAEGTGQQSFVSPSGATSPPALGHAAKLSVVCSRRGNAGSSHASACGWDLRVRLKQEPFRFTLAPRSLRSALDTVISVGFAIAAMRGRSKSLPTELATAEDTPPIDDGEGAKGDAVAVQRSGSTDGGRVADSLALDLDLDVAAPVLRWGLLPQGHVTIALGRLRFRTCGSAAPPPMELAPPESCSWRNFTSCCYLTETSVAVQAEGSECWVYDPSTICLRAWRETGGEGQDVGCWQMRVDSEVVRWTADPGVLKAAAQLPLSLDFALSPLRDVLTDASADAAAANEAANNRAEGGSPQPAAHEADDELQGRRKDTAEVGPRVCINLCLRRFELICSLSETPSRVSFVTEGIEGQYMAYADCLLFQSKVAQCEVAYEGESVVSCVNGGFLRVRNANRHIAVTGGSALIAVQWHERRVREVMAAMSEACDCLVVGRESAQGLLVVGEESKGTSAQLWSRYVSRPIQARVQRQAATRLAELLPGVSAGFEHQISPRPSSTPEDLSLPCASSDAGSEAPVPRGECSIEVNLAYEGLTATFMEAHEKCDQTTAPTMQVAVTGADCSFRGYRCGDAGANVSLLAADLAFRGRRLLTPRRADKLLQLDVVRLASASELVGPATYWTASWAQVCVLFRQRDYDILSQFIRTSVLGALPTLQRRQASPADSAVSSAAPAACDSADSPEEAISPAAPAGLACFRLDIGAPLVFLPTDRSTVASSAVARNAGVAGKDDCVPGGDSMVDTRSGDGGQLEVDAGREPRFTPRPGDGFLECDFGHVAASWGGEGAVPGDISLQLSGAHVKGACPSKEKPPVPSDVLCPVSVDAVLKTGGEGPIEFHATSTMRKASSREVAESFGAADQDAAAVPVDHCMSFTRSKLTLILDMLAENICYGGRSNGGALPSGRKSSKSSNASREAAADGDRKPGRGFRFSWSWPGDLLWDIAFTEAAPVVRLRLRGGCFSIDMSSTRSMYGLSCATFSAADMRRSSRNANKSLLECTEQPGMEPGFKVHVDFPVDSDGLAVVQLARPVMHILPQLVLDVVTCGTSAWQHCTFRNDRPRPGKAVVKTVEEVRSTGVGKRPQPITIAAGAAEAAPRQASASPDTRCTRIEVNLLDGAFRIAQQWSQPTEHFEFAGSLLMHFCMHAEGIRIERFDLEGGALRLRSSRRRSHTTLCPCIEWIVRGEQRRTDDDERMKRHSRFDFRSVIIPAYSIRMSAQDHRSMMGALMELCGLDADTAEPSEELASRDPLAANLVENRITITAEASIQGAEVQILGVEGGHAWPGLKGHLRCPLIEAIVEIRPGAAPTVNLFTKELEVELWSHNHRLGVWEPVVASCHWRVSYHMQRKPDGGPREVSVRGDVSAASPVRLVLGAPFINLAARVFRPGTGDLRYGHLLAGLNISGFACSVAVEGGGEHSVLGEDIQVQPLDGLLKAGGRGGPMTDPCLELSVVGEGGGRKCRVPLGREVCTTWNTGSKGWFLCRLIMPRPAQHLLLISSTVCIRNLTPTDLEVRFMVPRRQTSTDGTGPAQVEYDPVLPHAAFRSFDPGCMGADRLAAGASTMDDARPPQRPAPCGTDGALRLGAGQVLSAPPEAQLRLGQVVLQLRPAPEAAGGIAYEWSDSFLTVPTSGPGSVGVTVCSTPPRAMRDVLPRHWLHVQTTGGSPEEGWSFVDVQAPFTIVNACPCDAFCRLNPRVSRTVLGVEKSRFALAPGTTTVNLIVFDGRGEEVRVPPGGQAEIFPLRLDNDKYFYWKCNGKKERLRSRWSAVNCITAVLNMEQNVIEWHCVRAVMDNSQRHSAPAPLRISAQSSLPVFDSVAEEITLSFALRDAFGTLTSWSLPVHALTSVRSVDEVIELEHRRMYVRVSAYRRRRELVLYTKWWFVNSTGLNVELMQPGGGPGPMHPVPCFGGQAVAFLPEGRNDAGDGVAHVQLRSNSPVAVRVPDIGGSEHVDLTPLHPCCLRAEAVAMPESMSGVSCCLVSLLPSLLLFNKTDLEVGFRLVSSSAEGQGLKGSGEVCSWVAPGASGTLWGVMRGERALQIRARPRHASSAASGIAATETSWSDLFEVKETHIGAYPLTLKLGSNARLLMCVCIDQDAAVFSVTIRDSTCCHTILNRHPGLTLDARMESAGDDPTYLFSVPHGERVGIAGKGPTAEGNWSRLRLVVKSVDNPGERAGVVVHLNRTGLYKVPLCSSVASAGAPRRTPARSTLRTPTLVGVELRNRVAVITVSPCGEARGGPEFEETNSYTIQGEVRMDMLSIALLSEGATPLSMTASAEQRGETLTVSLAGVNMQLDQTPGRRRDVNFRILDAQVDLQRPSPHVLFRSTTRPFVETKTQREDFAMLDVHLRNVKVVLGEIEVSVTDAAWEQIRRLRRSFSTGESGLAFTDVLARASMPYHLTCVEPPASSSKIILSNLDVSSVKVAVWCEIYLPDAHYVPRTLRDAIQMASFGTNNLHIKGANLQVPRQTLFCDRSPCEGSASAVVARVSDNYLPHVKACWRSLLQHSNIFLGGLLSRSLWMPRQRQACWPQPPVCGVRPGSGELFLLSTTPRSSSRSA